MQASQDYDDHDDQLTPAPNELELVGTPPNAAERAAALRSERDAYDAMIAAADRAGGCVIRYAPTCIPPLRVIAAGTKYEHTTGGVRTLMLPAQARYTYTTPEQAQAVIDSIIAGTDAETLRREFGDPSTYEVRACPCYPFTGDPKRTVFE